MIGNQVKTFYCMDCLADYLGCSVDDLLEKLKNLRKRGVLSSSKGDERNGLCR